MQKQKSEMFRILMFFLVVVIALVFSFSFSNWGRSFSNDKTYELHALFEEIGNLRVGSPVKLSGVPVGRISVIKLNNDYQAEVVFRISKAVKLPVDSSVKVVTQGLLGGNYLLVSPGVSEEFLRPYSQVQRSYSAFILENFINKAISKLSSKEDKE